MKILLTTYSTASIMVARCHGQKRLWTFWQEEERQRKEGKERKEKEVNSCVKSSHVQRYFGILDMCKERVTCLF